MSEQDKKVKDIEQTLLITFSNTGMDCPSNFDEILEFVVEDVNETADPIDWSDADVIIGLRRWIESK